MDRRRPDRESRRGSALRTLDDEPTLVGLEASEDISDSPVLVVVRRTPGPMAEENDVAPDRLESTLLSALHTEVKDGRRLDGSVYVSGHDGIRVRLAVAALLEEYGYQTSDVGEPRRGSWWQRIVALFSADELPRHDPDDDFLTDPRAARPSYLERLDEEIRARQERLALDLIDAVAEQDEVVVVLNTVLVLKYRGRLTVSSLTPRQLSEIGDNPIFLTSPRAMYEYLSAASTPETAAVVPHRPPSRNTDAGPGILA